jgi:hypothetical protein
MSLRVCRHALSLLGATLLLVGAMGAAQADPVALGARTIPYGSSASSISVNANPLYTSVRLCVGSTSLEIYDLDLNFANGGRQDATIRENFAPGGCTRWIDLSGGLRHITRIDFSYATQGSSGTQAVVTAYGR